MPTGAGSDAASLSTLSLQRAAEGAATLSGGSDLRSTVDAAVSSGGRPLDRSVRTQMEGAFDADFGNVRIHTGRAAATSARALQAAAYTQGSDIVFGQGNYAPATGNGRHLLAHELAHVVQQRAGRVAASDTGRGVAVSDPGDRFERAAEETARVVTRKISRAPTPSAETMLGLQATAGNAAVARWRAAASGVPVGAGVVQRCGGHPCAGNCDHSEDAHETTEEVTATSSSVSRSTAGTPAIQRAACPATPTRLGDVPLDAASDCAEPSVSVSGERIFFCNDSDVMTDAGEALLTALVPLLMTMDVVDLHGFASPEGPAGRETVYNMNLSCRRAQAVAARLIASGVPASRINVFKHGGGSEFGSSRPDNRVVVIPIGGGGRSQGPITTRFRVASVSYLACAGCNPFTDDGSLALSPPATEPAVGSGYRMKHWIEAEVATRDRIHIESGTARVLDKGHSVGIGGYCGRTAPALILLTMESVKGITDPVHGEGLECESELASQVNVSVPPTLPGAPCGPIGTSPMIPPIRSRFRIRVFADGTKESGFVSTSKMPLHYLYDDGQLKMFGGTPVRAAVDFPAWATSTGVSLLEAETGLKALRVACCAGGTGLPGCLSKCVGGGTVTATGFGIDPTETHLACLAVGAGLAMRSCPTACAAAGAACTLPKLPANP